MQARNSKEIDYKSEDISDSVIQEILSRQHAPVLGTVITEWQTAALSAAFMKAVCLILP